MKKEEEAEAEPEPEAIVLQHTLNACEWMC